MFTGLVQELGTVASLHQRAGGARIRLESALAASLADGDSVLVNGVCLTATGVADESFEADLSPETLMRTSLGGVDAGERVNLEPALRAADRLGGHIVQGHVDGMGEVTDVSDAGGEGGARSVRFSAPPELLRYVVEKGSVAVDGVSLTVTDVDKDGFAVSLIPETLARTTLGDAAPGGRVNLEVDVIAKYVEKLIGDRVGNSDLR